MIIMIFKISIVTIVIIIVIIIIEMLNVHMMTNDNDSFLENDASILATKTVIGSTRDLATGVVGYP